MSKRKMHFAWFVGTYYGPTGWDAPHATKGMDWRTPAPYQTMAEICERGMFDIAIVADRLGVCNVYEESVEKYVKYGFDGVCHDSTVLAPIMAATTKHIGVATTISTSLTQPYLMARQTATVDHLTNGRSAFNIVTTATGPGYEVLGIDETFEQGDRYERADEYMELCFELWNSWEPDSIIMDRKTGVFADPNKVHTVDFDGKYYKCHGPLNVAPCPQGRPAIVQAGTSPRGRDFAAKWADAIIASGGSAAEMKAFRDDVRERAVAHGRNPDDVKVFFGVLPVIGETEAIADYRATRRSKWSWGPQNPDTQAQAFDGSLALLAYQWNLDLSQFELDEPLPQLDLATMRNTQAVPYLEKYYAMDPRPTLREMVLLNTGGGPRPGVMGTPLQVADQLESLFDEVGGDGFFLRADCHNHAYMSEFVNTVIPILQERGRVRTEYPGTTLLDNLREL